MQVTEDTEELLRQQMIAIRDMGVAQRALAEQLDADPSWLSRWLAGMKTVTVRGKQVNVRRITVPEMDRFRAYVRRFQKTLEETQRTAAAEKTPAATTARPGNRFRKRAR